MKINVQQKRDKSLDVIKGVACILMLLAHSRTQGRTDDTQFTIFLWEFGFLAAVLFFAGIGMSVVYQLKKRTIAELVIFYLVMIWISFADVGKTTVNYFSLGNVNLFFSLGIACIISIFLIKRNNLIVTLAPLGIYLILGLFNIPFTPIYGLLFGVIPWLSFILFGNLLFKEPSKVMLYFIVFTLLDIISFLGGQTIVTEAANWAFIFSGFALTSFLVLISPKLIKIKPIENLLTYLSLNSLLFYWLHIFILYVLPVKIFAPLLWLGLLLLTIILMKLLDKLNQLTFQKISSKIYFWLPLLFSIIIPLVFQFSPGLRFYFFNVVILIYALNYRGLYELIKHTREWKINF